MKKMNIKTSFVLRIAFVLFCVVLITFYMVSVLYARYTTKVSDSSLAGAAKFDIQVMGDADVSADVSQTIDDIYTVTISNNSEVAVEYTLSVTEIPGVSITFDSNSGILQPGAEDFPCNLTFDVTDWNLITADMEGAEGSVTLKFTITVKVEQVN